MAKLRQLPTGVNTPSRTVVPKRPVWCTPRPSGKPASEMLIITRLAAPFTSSGCLTWRQQTTEGYPPATRLRLVSALLLPEATRCQLNLTQISQIKTDQHRSICANPCANLQFLCKSVFIKTAASAELINPFYLLNLCEIKTPQLCKSVFLKRVLNR